MAKEKKSKKSKKYIPPPEEEQEKEQEQESSVQETNNPPVNENQSQEDFDPAIRMRFSFVNSIYQILLLANSRVNWEPEELVPVGMVLRDLKSINVQMVNAIQERRKQIESQKNNEDENSESVESTESTESTSTA